MEFDSLLPIGGNLLPLGGAVGLFAIMLRAWWRDQTRRENEQERSDARHHAELERIDKLREAERKDYERRIAFLQSQIDSLGKGGE